MAQIMIMLPCCLGYVWAADKFCKKHLKISIYKEILFVGCIFLMWLVANLVSVSISIPYIVPAFLYHLSLMGAAVLLFQEEWEKRLLVSAVFVTAVTLIIGAGDFSLKIGGFGLGGIGTATVAAILLNLIMEEKKVKKE